jgi:hypothetical protein
MTAFEEGLVAQNKMNGTVHFKKCKQLFEYQHLLLLRDIWWSKYNIYINAVHFFNTSVN